LCDDRKLARSHCRNLLAETQDMQVVGEADGGHAGVELALAVLPDVVVMDVEMPDLNGLEATRRIAACKPEIKVLAYSAGADLRVARDIMAAGASGYVLKDGDSNELVGAIRVIMKGGRYLSQKVQSPASVESERDQATDSDGARRDRRPPKAVQVILVDDSAVVRDRLAALLSALEGIEVSGQAADVISATHLIRERTADVLISDLDLPVSSGIELLHTVRRERGSMLVIILTDYDHPKLRQMCANLGADFYFHKPTEFEKVLEVCQNLARARGLTAANARTPAGAQ
jgi:two-component system, NarL family, invasion response regulator UvrY